MSAISIKNLTLEKDERIILHDLSLEIPKGKITAIIGPNGAGKSTLSSLIMGLERFNGFSGDILFEGKSIKDLSVFERSKLGITLAWQNSADFEGIKIRKYLEVSGRSNENFDIRKSLEIVGLNPDFYLDRFLDSKLSGGERKRVELAAVYSMNPKVVVIDEPDSGIDVESMDFVFDTIESFKKKGTTVIIVTHSLDVLKKSDYGILLCNGKLVDEGDVEDISKYFLSKCLSCKRKNEF